MDRVLAELMEEFEAATWKDLCLLQNLQLQTPSEEIAVLIRKTRKELKRIRNTEQYVTEPLRVIKAWKHNSGRRIPSKTE